MFRELADNPEASASALGMFQTERYLANEEQELADFDGELEWSDVSQHLQDGDLLTKNPLSRICYYQSKNSYLLFIDGNRWDINNCSEDWLEKLCSRDILSIEDTEPSCSTTIAPAKSGPATPTGNQQLLILLLHQGVWSFDTRSLA